MSDFWLRKMRTYFQRIDFDHDGAITRKDFEGMAKRFSKSGKLDKKKSEHLMDTLCAVWDKYLSAVGGGKEIRGDDFVAGMKKLVKEPGLRSTLEGPLPLFFHAVDSNDDGQIEENEYCIFFDILGLDSKMAPASFQAIDTNNDGMLSEQEFKDAGADFFLSEDEKNPTQLFWGPLV